MKWTVHFFHIRGFGDCDCGGKVVVLNVEAVSPRGAVDRRVLTADVDAGLGLITSERSGFDHAERRREDLLIPVTGSAVGVDGGGVERKE